MRLSILGVKIDRVEMGDVLEQIKIWLDDIGTHQIVTVNPEFIIAAQKNKSFKEILNRADLAVADGAGLVMAAKFLGQGRLARVTGVDLTKNLFSNKIEKLKIYLLGGAAGVAQEVKDKNPQAPIVGADSGGSINTTNWSLANNETTIEKINASGANILLVALGQIKQEMWLASNLKFLSGIKVAIGVGGTFDYLSGRVQRAPKLFQALGLEWLYRLIRQPQRLGRIYNAVVKFSYLILKEKILTR